MNDFWEKYHSKLVTYAKQTITWNKLKFEPTEVVTYAFEKTVEKEFKTEVDRLKYCKSIIKNSLLQDGSEFKRENASLNIKEIKDDDLTTDEEDRNLPDINIEFIKRKLDHYNRVLFQYYFIESLSSHEINKRLIISIPDRTLRHQIKELKHKVKEICKQLYNL